jgi:hypothetical protein
MRRRILLFFLLVSAPLIGLLGMASPAGASDLTGSGDCSGSASTKLADGGPSKVSAPGRGGTESDPFVVEWDNPVPYDGQSGQVFKNHSWKVRVFFVPVRTGGSPNDEGDTTTNSSVVPKDFLKIKMTGLYYVDGDIAGDGGISCQGSTFVKLAGNPLVTIPFWFGVILTLGGAWMILGSRPTRTAAAAPPGGFGTQPGPGAGSTGAGSTGTAPPPRDLGFGTQTPPAPQGPQGPVEPPPTDEPPTGGATP